MGLSAGDERGLTLVELLVALTISLLGAGSALALYDDFTREAGHNDKRNEATEAARAALDIQARQLRNLAKRVASPVIDTLAANDLIFQTSDPARTWVRYCLDTTTAPASPERARLWTAERSVATASTSAPVTAPMRGPCPGTGWPVTNVVADYVTNQRARRSRPMFAYACTAGTSCAASPSTYDQVVGITAQLLLDTTPGYGPSELRVSSGVHLRNQNQAPAATFVATRASASRTVVLNAAGSTDYEGRTLDYYWFQTTMPATASIDCARPTVTAQTSPRTLWGAAGYIGDGITLTYTFPASAGPAETTRDIGLVVCDPGDRFDVAGIAPKAAVAVAIPT